MDGVSTDGTSFSAAADVSLGIVGDTVVLF